MLVELLFNPLFMWMRADRRLRKIHVRATNASYLASLFISIWCV